MTAFDILAAAKMRFSARSAPQGRLTVDSSSSVSSSDLVGATNLFYLPDIGDELSLFDGSTWVRTKFGATQLSLSGLAPNTCHDVWGRLSSSSLALDTTAWTNDVTRAVAITKQDGVDVKSGDPTRILLGTIRTIGTAGQTADSKAFRYVSNRYNPVPREMVVIEPAQSWQVSNSTGWARANGNAANQLDFVCCVPRLVAAETVFLMSCTNAFGTLMGGIGLDTITTDVSTTKSQAVNPVTSGVYNGKGNFAGTVPAGRHYLAWLQAGSGNGGTLTAYGTIAGSAPNGSNALQAGISGMLFA